MQKTTLFNYFFQLSFMAVVIDFSQNIVDMLRLLGKLVENGWKGTLLFSTPFLGFLKQKELTCIDGVYPCESHLEFNFSVC